MSLEDWKSAYSQLDPASRKELARWIVEQEMGSGGGMAAGMVPPPPARQFVFPTRLVVILGGLAVLGLGIWQLTEAKQRKDAERARMTAAERNAAEASKPRSPRNLEYLRSQVGNPVTVTGVPELAEVGFLYFSKDKKSALRLNLMPSGVVLMQSGELEDLVEKKTELTISGLLEKTETGALEIKVYSVGQLRQRAP
jgi:hypothetical protein